MPNIYLSPSTQEFNSFYDGSGSEEFYMNLIADAMEPYLYASGIDFTRNTKEMTAASSIRQSNSGNYDLHLALHSNAAAGNNAGNVTGTDVYYYPYSTRGKDAADVLANNLKLIYPNAEKVRTVPTTSLGEVVRTKAPGVLIEYAFHDNKNDAEWIKNNINTIAENTVLSLTDYFFIPFNTPMTLRRLTVKTDGGNLNLRSGPSVKTGIIGSIPNGAAVEVFNENVNDFTGVRYNGKTGYVSRNYLV